MKKGLTAMCWHGGKSLHGRKGKMTRWIIENLPMAPGYCEPFAGMLGVLLNRQPVRHEIVNDLDGHVANWWRCVRERRNQLAYWIRNTAPCRQDYERAVALLASSHYGKRPSVEHAWAMWIVTRDGVLCGPNNNAFAVRFAIAANPGPRPDVLALSERMRDVTIENRNAVDLLRRLAKTKDYAIYCDPPYAGTLSKQYSVGGVDRDALAEALTAQQGPVMVSGYGGEWDCLGWSSQGFTTMFVDAGGVSTEREERIWYSNFTVSRGLFGE